MVDAARLLGFAFANADFLFEVDGNGKILFATGAASEFTGESGDALRGRPVSSLFAPPESKNFLAHTRNLLKGDRAGPFKLKLAAGHDASVAMFRLPQNDGRISCTLTRFGAKPAGPVIDAATGLASRDAFLAVAAEMGGENAKMSLVEVPDLPDACARLGEEEAGRLLRHIGVSLTQTGARAAGRLSETSFGIVADSIKGKTDFSKHVRKALAEGGAGDLDVKETLVALKGQGLTPEQRMLAVRYVVDQFASGEQPRGSQADIAVAFHQMMDETQVRVRSLTESVADGAFSLAYQPIISFATGDVSHYEALARFTQSTNTGETIKFVEAMGIADAFDLAVAVKIFSIADSTEGKHASIAFNVSGHTISSPSSFGVLTNLLERHKHLASRVLVEITETAAIPDLEAANRSVGALRAMGFRVGLDDFGSGAASLHYLHAFSIDFVKFDGSLVKKIGMSKRDDTLLAGVVKLCKELGIHTIAEFIDGPEVARRAKELGFDYGQGNFLGEASQGLPQPGSATAPASASSSAASAAAAAAAAFARRKGTRESWG
ncbi:MAG TPA: EAL domain-containing protein [Rhizomicrobium sp.]|nr:EAL domain-containing protein [Rhizomicrobium sp.]